MLLVAAVCFLSRNVAAMPVWIDTDASIGSPIREVDDGFALVLALHSPELAIKGISTSYGNASLGFTTATTRKLVGNFGARAGIDAEKVVPGAASARALGKKTAATVALMDAARGRPLTYIALAPLTNLATALMLDPSLQSRIDRVVFVGGLSRGDRLSIGRLTVHDANVFKDPRAVEIVLASTVPITLVSIEGHASSALTDSELRQLRGTPTGEFLFHSSRWWWHFWRVVAGTTSGPIFDANAVLAAVQPGARYETPVRVAMTKRSSLTVVNSSGRAVMWRAGFARDAKTILLRRLRGEN